jgi:phage baseplate assembly protein W
MLIQGNGPILGAAGPEKRHETGRRLAAPEKIAQLLKKTVRTRLASRPSRRQHGRTLYHDATSRQP